MKSKIYDEYANLTDEQRKVIPNLKTYIQIKRCTHLNQDYSGNLAKYLKPAIIGRFSDPCLRFIDRSAIKWRMNRLNARKQCPVCKDIFHRGHVINCELLPLSLLYPSTEKLSAPKDTPLIMSIRKFHSDLKTFDRTIDRHTYCYLDHLISENDQGLWKSYIGKLNDRFISNSTDQLVFPTGF